MMSSDDKIPYNEIVNNKVRPSLQGLTLGDWLFAGICGMAVVVAALWFASSDISMFFIVPVIAVAVVLNLSLPTLPYAHFYHGIWMALRSLYIRLVLRDVLWVSNDYLQYLSDVEPDSPYLRDSEVRHWFRDRRYVRSEDKRAIIPLSIEYVEAHGVHMGVLNQLDSNEGHIYVLADGSLYGGLDAEGQYNAHLKLSAAINRFVARSPLPVGVSQLRVSRPGDLTEMQFMMAESGDPFMTKTQVFALTEEELKWVEWRQENFSDLGATARSFGATANWMLMVVTFQWKDEWRRAANGKIDEQQIHDLGLLEMGRVLVDELRVVDEMGIQNPHIMSPIELAHFTHCALDVTHIDEYYLRRARGEIPADDEDLLVITSEMVEAEPELYSENDIGTMNLSWVWPTQRIEVYHDRLRLDDTWFMVVREIQIAERERTDSAQLVHAIMPVGTSDSFAAVSQKTSGEIESRTSIFGEALRRGLTEDSSRRKIILHPRVRRREQARADYLEQITVNSTNQRYHRVRVLAAGTSKELDNLYKDLTAGASSLGVRLMPVTGRARQIDGFITGQLGANRL